MMKFAAFIGMCMLTVMLGLTGFGFMITGILLDGGKNEPWGELAAVSFIVTAIAGFITGCMDDAGWDVKPLSRANRKVLRAERERVQLDAAIKKLESEVYER